MASELDAARERVNSLGEQIVEARVEHEQAVRASDSKIELAALAAEEVRLTNQLSAIKADTAEVETGATAAAAIEQVNVGAGVVPPPEPFSSGTYTSTSTEQE